MSVTYNFEGQVALVTGGNSGMGFATALAFARAGASVTVAGLNQDLLDRAVEEIRSDGGKVIGIHCDVADESQVADMVERTVAEFGRLDAAFNNAGIQVPRDVAPCRAGWPPGRGRHAVPQSPRCPTAVRLRRSRRSPGCGTPATASHRWHPWTAAARSPASPAWVGGLARSLRGRPARRRRAAKPLRRALPAVPSTVTAMRGEMAAFATAVGIGWGGRRGPACGVWTSSSQGARPCGRATSSGATAAAASCGKRPTSSSPGGSRRRAA